ncbi:putative extracelular serine carboxypeptidase [Talaromyces proteolyticus]|uniref:Extracelular serine carboxypeptidase n=1 Tax=Talaromyces proteolyticus TaxID=1131652 RepID=A0AAD4PVL0_9EURO|nr:putative extracelular serine carboxypeptidase [Talaromyces proteolyticus]KAH8690818.1 putative extracelular serine carboxypeptidase [Talaromyces proteolyticus]
MRNRFLKALSLLAVVGTAAASTNVGLGRKGYLRTQSEKPQDLDVDPSTIYPAYNLSVPIDHFHNDTRYAPHSNSTFPLRYWFDASHYKKGGPVFVLGSGEASGEERLPFLQKGLIAQLAQETNGIAVVLEHRYYGTSIPTPDLSTESLRFLTTEQALADAAYFAKNIVFPGFEDQSITAHDTPYIAYGGSYAGAFVAFLRVVYPEVYFGAISSSGVTEAIIDYWQYWEPIRKYAPRECVNTNLKFTQIIDNLASHKSDFAALKGLFGLQNLTYANDFASILNEPLTAWQNRNWDPAIDDPTFFQFCGNITSNSALFSETASRTTEAQRLVAAAGFKNESKQLTTRLLNYVGWLNQTVLWPCIGEGQSADSCFSTHDYSFYLQDDISQDWRSWDYQVCTEWGFYQTGSGTPKNELAMISRLIDVDYLSIACRYAFNITSPPDVQRVNKYGGFGISYPRLAIIGGQADPWRESTPLADAAKPRKNTINRPVVEIEGAVHHWDENGLFPNETSPTLPPAPVANAQEYEHVFIKDWLKAWSRQRRNIDQTTFE